MHNVLGRWAAALLLGLSLAAATSIELGCATPDFVGSTLGRPTAPRSDESARRAYEAGYEAGRHDDQRDLRADYTRYQRAYDWSTERAFATGYRDGYGRHDDRYGSADPRARSEDDQGEDEDEGRRGYVSRAVPEWLVGDYRGWNEAYESDVALSIHPNASVLLVADGRERKGVYSDGQVRFRNGAYVVTRVRDGIRCTSVDDSRNRLYLRRVD
jgi:hypothetical protein